MARSQGWSITVALLVGFAGATVFWFYGPFLKKEVSRQVEEAVKDEAAQTAKTGNQTPLAMKSVITPGAGARYQVVTDGKQTFLADLKEGRVWRYFHHPKEGQQKEEEGFLPLPFFYGGKQYPTADLKSGE